MTDLIQKLRDCARAYPDDMFLPVTPEQRAEHPMLITQASAAMGRHFSPLFTEAADEIDRLRRDAERYRKLRDDFTWTLDSRIDGARLSIHMPGVSMSVIGPDADEFDAAIDAAMNGANA